MFCSSSRSAWVRSRKGSPAVLPVPNSLPVAPQVAHRPAPVDERWLYRLWYRAGIPLPVQLFTGPINLFHSPDFVLPPVRGGIPTLLTVHDLSFVHYPATFPANLVAYETEQKMAGRKSEYDPAWAAEAFSKPNTAAATASIVPKNPLDK